MIFETVGVGMEYLYIYRFAVIFNFLAAIFIFIRAYLYKGPFWKLGNRFHDGKNKVFTLTLPGIIPTDELDTIFHTGGIKINGDLYKVIRISLLTLMFAGIMLGRLFFHEVSRIQVIIWLLLIVITSPRKEFAGMKTPFIRIMNLLTDDKKKKMGREIYRAICQLRNLSIAREDSPVGSYYILEELCRYSRLTRPVFTRVLALWYQNERQLGADLLEQSIPTKEGRVLADILLKLDQLNPFEFRDQLHMCLQAIKAENRTQKEKQNEIRGMVLYSMVIISVIVVLVNFLLIVVMLDSLGALQKLSN